MADEEERLPLEGEERENIQADLDDLQAMRAVFEPQGTKGVVVACPDCGEDHYYGWDLLKESLEHMLSTGEPRMHEPAFEPREEDYVVWDYGKGYVDALSDAGLDGGGPAVDLQACVWCRTPLEPHFGFCPRCGRLTAPARLLRELTSRGIDEREARALLVRAGFEPFP
jgi:predicted RNA-binding Zn-ribbon protein involved in translation (DUF1610 family)